MRSDNRRHEAIAQYYLQKRRRLILRVSEQYVSRNQIAQSASITDELLGMGTLFPHLHSGCGRQTPKRAEPRGPTIFYDTNRYGLWMP